MTAVLRLALLSLLVVVALAPAAANAAQRDHWEPCSNAAGNRAARSAGLLSALDRDPTLRRVFFDQRPSKTYRSPSESLCADYNGDGRLDRAVHYQCCTVSSPAPWVVLKGTRDGYRISYKRLSDTTFKIEGGDGIDLVTTEPRYDFSKDALCCPSKLRIGTLRWDGKRFRRTFEIVDAQN